MFPHRLTDTRAYDIAAALRDGLLKNLHVTMDRPETVVAVFGAALKRYPRRAAPAGETAEED